MGKVRRLLFLNFNLVNRADRWMSRRFSPCGRLLLGALLLGTVFGVNTRIAPAYQLALLSVCLIGVALLWAPAFRPRLGVTRRLPAYAQVGQACTYALVIRNEGPKPLSGLRVIEDLSPDLQVLSGEGWRQEPEDRHRNWFDRNVGYPRWSTLMRLARGAVVAPVDVAAVLPGRRVEAPITLTPLRRGYLRFRRMRFLRADPLGIFYGQKVLDQDASLLVLPRTHPVVWPDSGGRHAHRDPGPAVSNRHGGTDEFSSIREYQPGDSPRHLHWRGWARYGVPVVKEFHHQQQARRTIILVADLPDTSSSRAFEGAVEVAASLTRSEDGPLRPCALVLGAQSPEWVDMTAGQEGGVRLLESLACVTPAPPGCVDMLPAFLGERVRDIDECTIVFVGWESRYAAFLEEVAAMGLGFTAICVTESENAGPGDLQAVPASVSRVACDAIGAGLAELRGVS